MELNFFTKEMFDGTRDEGKSCPLHKISDEIRNETRVADRVLFTESSSPPSKA